VEKDGNVIFETDIIVKEDVKKAKWYVLFGRYLGELYGKIFG
jgi:D-alanyl-D-alanine carboxypeptidase (penicillin-binding protein 5/6)